MVRRDLSSLLGLVAERWSILTARPRSNKVLSRCWPTFDILATVAATPVSVWLSIAIALV